MSTRPLWAAKVSHFLLNPHLPLAMSHTGGDFPGLPGAPDARTAPGMTCPTSWPLRQTARVERITARGGQEVDLRRPGCRRCPSSSIRPPSAPSKPGSSNDAAAQMDPEPAIDDPDSRPPATGSRRAVRGDAASMAASIHRSPWSSIGRAASFLSNTLGRTQAASFGPGPHFPAHRPPSGDGRCRASKGSSSSTDRRPR